MELHELLGAQAGDDSEQPKKDSPLKSLKVDLDFYAESIKEIAVEIMAEGLSAYPIFIAHQHELKVGELILDKNELGTDWSIHASTLEEFVETGIIKEDRKVHFVKQYKKPADFMCVFVVVPEGANFIFYPYKA